MFLLIHDLCRGRKPKIVSSQVAGRVPANVEGQLCPVARGTNPQLPGGADSVSDCTSHCLPAVAGLVVSPRLTSLVGQPFVSTVGIAWTAYLSLTNSAEDEEVMVHS